jgi:hypothetical protein
MRLEANLRSLEANLTDNKDEGHHVIRLKSGRKRLLPREVTDFVETNGDTEDKLNFDRINKGYAGLRTGIYDKKSKFRKACMDRNQPIDVYHQV